MAETDSAGRAVAVTPADGTDFTNVSRAIYVGGAGDLSVVTLGGDTVTFSAVAAGSLLPIRVRRVRSTGTTATLILNLW